ncbi:MAG: glycosyltransferase family 39 protein [Byssovorax sp.]
MSRLRAVLPALFVLASLIFVGLIFARTPPPLRAEDELRITPAQGDQLGSMMNPGPDGGGSGYRLEGGEIRETFGVFRYIGPAGSERAVVELHHRDTVADAARKSEKFALVVKGGAPPPALLDALAAKLRAGEGAFTWIETGGPVTPRAAFLRRFPNLQLPIAWFLLAQAPLWLLFAIRRAILLLADLSRRARLALLGAVFAAALTRLVLAPLRLVMLYIGYQLTAQSLALKPIPRYGAGVPALHHLLLVTFGADHHTLLVAHAILGVAMVPLVAALAHALFRRSTTTLAAAFLWALVPAFVAHDASEAVTVPILVELCAGLLLFTEAITERRLLPLTGAAALLTLTMVSRPEMPALAPLAALGLGLALSPKGVRWALPWLVLMAPATAALIVPHLVHVLESAAMMKAQDSLPMGKYTVSFIHVGVLDPALYPALLWPFALASLLPFVATEKASGEARPAYQKNLLLVAIAAADFGLTWVDLDPANILRVQVPGALFFALAAASGMDGALERLKQAAARPGRLQGKATLAAIVAIASIALSAIPCLAASFQKTNEDEEESFLRAARAALPPGDRMLVRLGYGDLEGSQSGAPVHLHFPDYLFSPPGGPKRTRDIAEWMKDPTDPHAYFYLGVRCYTPERSYDEEPGGRAPELPPLRRACQEILDRYGDGSVIERDAPNHGDPVKTGYYGWDTSRTMHLALVHLKTGAPPR